MPLATPCGLQPACRDWTGSHCHALLINLCLLAGVLEAQECAWLCRTGCGKTLAFVLPIVQRLLDGNQAARPEKGRAPRVIVLAPTRELAKQVLAALLPLHTSAPRSSHSGWRVVARRLAVPPLPGHPLQLPLADAPWEGCILYQPQ